MAEEKLTLKTFLESSQFTKGANKVKNALGGIGKAASRLGATISAAMAVQAVRSMVTFAGEAEKTDLRMKRVFANMSSEVSSFSSQLSGSLGRVESDIQSGLVSFQAFFQGLGFGGREAAKYSQKMQALSLDLASFFQIQDANAQKRFLAALAGSPEVLDQFGINLKEAALQQELLNMGLDSSVQKTNEMTKTTARLSIIMRAMTENGIVGDAKRTMNTYAQQVTIAESSMKTLAIAIGEKFLPAAQSMLDIFIKITNNVTKLFTSENKLLDLNEEQQEAFLLQANSVARLVKEGGNYTVILDNLIAKYPKFLGQLDKNKLSSEKLLKRVEDLNKAFEKQNEIYESNAKLAGLQENAEQLRLKFQERQLAIQVLTQKLATTPQEQKKEIERIKSQIKVEQIQLDNRHGIVGITEQLEKAQKALNDELARQNKLFEERDALAAFTDVYGGEEKQAIPERASDFGSIQPMGKTFDAVSISDGISEELKKIPQNIEPIRILWKDYFNLGGIEFVLDTIQENGKLIKNDFIDFDQTMGNALDGFANSMGQAFGGAINTALSGGKDLGTAIRLATKAALGGMAADLAANAMYFGILALGYKAGIIATGGATGMSAASASKAAAIFGAGAVVLGGVSAAISGKGGGSGSMSSSGTGGDANNRGGIGGGTFEDFMNSIRGEQVFRLAGNDLVTAINRTDTFQGSIGG
tara:strand:- start:2240 stop:4339 length:2100 start_codon:yes stop_codon:yes gene_type:complete